jgi:cbb3-type cytochrome oxidase maturation protein
MVHTVLIIVSLSIAAIGLAAYLWDTREDAREFGRRVQRAERIRNSYGHRMPRGGSRP